MRGRLLLAAWMLLGAAACAHDEQGMAERQRAAVAAAVAAVAAPAPPSGDAPARRVDFATQVRPILEARCQPCHFPGGKMYARLPFDRAETIIRLREKLFTRIKDEDQRRVLREFLAQHSAASEGAAHPAG